VGLDNHAMVAVRADDGGQDELRVLLLHLVHVHWQPGRPVLPGLRSHIRADD
jgi:hypothetical protein